MLAEQQRAKSEIEAALTIANHMPRDEKRAMDAIIISCQRPGLAAKSQYEYSRGGTAISGASIVLMEAIAQRWGNIDFGFRELSRYPGRGNQPGESVIEAYAWDLESNTRRKVVFTVEHAMRAHNKTKVLTDPRDIYEYLANQAQRRVRTCLENIIPRDIVESACEECDRTLKAHIDIGPKTISQLLERFATIGISKEQIESRIQRHIDAVTPAQILHLGKIFSSISDGMSEPGDWFDASAAPESEGKQQTAVDKAKQAMRRQKQPATTTNVVDPNLEPRRTGRAEGSDADGRRSGSVATSAPREREPGDDDEPTGPAEPFAEQVSTWLTDLESVGTLKGLNDALVAIPAVWPEEAKQRVASAIKAKIERVHASRGSRSNKPSDSGEPSA